MATVYLGLIQLVNEFGLSAAIIQQRELKEDHIARLGGLSMLVGCALFLVSIAVSPLVARFFNEPKAQLVIAVLSGTFVLRALQMVPRAVMNRDLNFRRLAWIDGIEAVSHAFAALILALLGLSYWALVLASLVAVTVSTSVAVAWQPHRIAWPRDFATISSPVTFGGHVAMSRVAWFVFSNADFAIVGRFLGTAALGAYSFGWTLAHIPVERVTALVGRVTPAIFAAVQDKPTELRRYVLGLTEGLAILTFPASVGTALVAQEFVLVVLGPDWQPAVAPLRLLCLYGGFRSVTALLPQVMVATNQTKRNLQASVASAIVLPALFLLGTRWGTAGVATMWVIGFPVVVVPFFVRFAFRAIGATTGEFLLSLWPAVSGCIAMAVAITSIRELISDVPLLPRFGALVVTGALTYAGMLMLFHRQRLTAFWSIALRARRQ